LIPGNWKLKNNLTQKKIKGETIMTRIEEVKAKVEAGKSKLVPGLVQEALDAGDKPSDILQAMVDSMGVVGDKFSAGEIFVPEMLIAAKAMAKGVDVLKPLLAGDGATSLGTCVIGTVAGDLHDIGKNLVSMMIESAGFDMVDLGVDVPAEKFVKAAKENDNVVLVACSGLLTTTMPALKEAVQTIKAGIPEMKVIVGGAPVTPEYAVEVGADGYAPDAGSAAVKAKELVTA
jgi:methanogenic corrinoid protein MtbC1